MAERVEWRDLTRMQQRIIAKLYGSGSVRNCDLEALIGLRLMALLDGEERSSLGLQVCEKRLAELEQVLGPRPPSRTSPRQLRALPRSSVNAPRLPYLRKGERE